MKISSFLISVLIVSFVVLGIYSFMDSMMAESAFNVTMDTGNYSRTYNRLNRTLGHIRDIENKTASIEPDESKSFFTGVWDTVTVVKDTTVSAVGATISSLTVGKELIGDFSSDLGVPEFVSTLLIALLTLGVIGAIFFLITKRQW